MIWLQRMINKNIPIGSHVYSKRLRTDNFIYLQPNANICQSLRWFSSSYWWLLFILYSSIFINSWLSSNTWGDRFILLLSFQVCRSPNVVCHAFHQFSYSGHFRYNRTVEFAGSRRKQEKSRCIQHLVENSKTSLTPEWRYCFNYSITTVCKRHAEPLTVVQTAVICLKLLQQCLLSQSDFFEQLHRLSIPINGQHVLQIV